MITATRTKRQRHVGGFYGPADYGVAPAAVTDPYVALFGSAPGAPSMTQTTGTHPLYDTGHNRRLLERESEITAAFDVIEPALKEVAAMQWQEGFADRAQALASSRLGFTFPGEWLTGSWTAPLDMRRLYAYAVFRTFRALAQRQFDRSLADSSEGEPAEALIRKWGFHTIDISPCADGRLSGVVDYILRVPPSVVVHRKSFAGSMFDVEESVRNWVEIELRRHREGVPNPADAPTRYLKIGVYHTSSSDPAHEGCAAHGSDERKAASALLDRLAAFRKAIENSHCCGASVAALLIGVDTDTDAIKVHVPDANGVLSLDRLVDNTRLYEATRDLARDEAKQAIRRVVAEAAGVAEDDAATEGMRWFVAYLLKNNMAQIEYVRRYHDGRYADLGHTERFIVVGDSFDDVQLRNLAYQAQMDTVEEGAADLDVGIKIFRKVNVSRGLPIPVFVHYRYDGRVPGARARRRALSAPFVRDPSALSGPGTRGLAAYIRGGQGSRIRQPPRGYRRFGFAERSQVCLWMQQGGVKAMKICQVEKTLVATARIGGLGNRRLLVVKERGGSGKQVAVDPVGCKPGDWVIVVGSSAARTAAGSNDYPSDFTIVGIIDYWEDDGKQDGGGK